LSFLSQIATDSDISQSKQKRKGADDDAPITDLHITSGHEPETHAIDDNQTEADLPLQDRTVEENTRGDELSDETEIVIKTVPGTKHQLSEASRSPGAVAPEDEVKTMTQVDTEGELHMPTDPPHQAEGVHESKSGDIEEGSDMVVDGVVEEEDVNGFGVVSCNSSASDNVPTYRVERRNSSASSLSSENSMGHVCPICLGGYEKGSMLFVSNHCAHIFHGDCILEWLTKEHEECPICRVKMVTQEEMVTAALTLVEKTCTTTTSKSS